MDNKNESILTGNGHINVENAMSCDKSCNFNPYEFRRNLNGVGVIERDVHDRNDDIDARILDHPTEFVIPDEGSGFKPFAKTKENEEEMMYKIYRMVGYILKNYKAKHGIENLMDVVCLLKVLCGDTPDESSHD